MPRRPTLLVLLLALAMVAAGCGSDNDATARASDAASTSSVDAQFPVTVEHKFGATEIDAGPQRIVSIGYQEHDVLYALGVQPVAVRYWFGDTDDVIFPWAEDDASGADPEILNMAYGELNYEKIAALRPDLILGVYSGITDKEYETLSAIAPTVAQPDGYVDFGIPWQVAARQAGTAVGRPDRAEELIDELEARFAEVREAHPEWAGQQVAVVAYRPAGTGVFASEDPRARFFTQLGFEVPAAIDEVAGEKFYGTLSPERFDVIDGDLVVWDQMTYVEGGRAAIIADPVVAGLQAMKEGRAIYMEGDLEAAFAFNSVLSLGFVLDEVVPLLEAATDGDPDTTG
ncbi:MAG: iron-siderophore ABC transporter substrate-binding protein [Acidimicrobiales bacterium]